MKISEQLRQATKSIKAGYGTFPKPYADIDENSLVIWVTFANFGRVHHVTNNLRDVEKLLDKLSLHAVAVLKNNGTPPDQSRADVYIDDIAEKRVSIGYIHFRPLKDKFDPSGSIARMKGIAGFKKMPTR